MEREALLTAVGNTPARGTEGLRFTRAVWFTLLVVCAAAVYRVDKGRAKRQSNWSKVALREVFRIRGGIRQEQIPIWVCAHGDFQRGRGLRPLITK